MRRNTYSGFAVLLMVMFSAISPARVLALGTDITSIKTQTIPAATAATSVSNISGNSEFTGGVFTLNFGGQAEYITEFTFAGGKAKTEKAISSKAYVRRNPVTDGRQQGYYQGTLDPSTNTFNFLSAGPLSEEMLFNLNNILAGTDDVFINTGANLGGVPYNGNVSIERLDFVLESPVKVKVDKGKDKDDDNGVGFAIFDRGTPTTHDPFGIAAITSVDELGHPTSYGPIHMIAAGTWGLTPLIVPIPQYYLLNNQGADHPGLPINPTLTIPSNQTLGGVLIRAEELVPSGRTIIYGYSLFAADVTCTSETLVNVSDACFPTNTGAAAGGLDLAAPNLGALFLNK